MRFPRRASLAIFLLFAGIAAPAATASAQTVYSVIANLDGNGAARRLRGGVIKAPNGALYGTGTESGILPICGAVYKVDPAGTVTIIHKFNRTDGCNPVGELVIGADGHLYGTTFYGGSNTDFFTATSGTGTAFRISMPGEMFTKIHDFAPRDSGTGIYPEGMGPNAGLTLGSDNNLYGTTTAGGTNQCGTIFRITPAGALTVLKSLVQADGCLPQSGLTRGTESGPDQIFYGTTATAGGGSGTLFKITAAGVFTKLFTFSLDAGCNCFSKGSGPNAAPVDDGAGYLWGTAISNGSGVSPAGTIWKFSKASGELTVLKTFNTTGGFAADGASPRAGMMLASDGYFYGTTVSGGANSQGTLYRVSLAGVHEVLHHFTSATGMVGDGRLIEPEPGVIIGTTQLGGSLNGGGVVFRRGPGALLALDKTSLVFGAVTTGAALTYKTSTQSIRLTQTSGGPVTWTATSNQPWLQVSPASGSGSAAVSLSVAFHSSLPLSGSVNASVTLVFNGALNSPGPITVRLNLLSGASQKPFGVIDTPIDMRTGVTGAVPFTGWALDDIEMSRVMICRAAVVGETAPIDPNCAGAQQIFVGFPVFIDLARPDLAVTYPEIPLNTRAGWGLMVLTNMLPNQGNGTYTFYFYAEDREGNTQLLGTRTITCDNAHGTLPFGAIDTPTQGGVASGASYVNFGWALTPLPKIIPVDGSTISVFIDGTSVGNVTYHNFRDDIATLFPGYANTAGAIGYRVLDTTAMTNGPHTISWIVTDNLGAAEGIGSRYFSVSNGVGSATAAVEARATAASLLTPDDIDWLPPSSTSLLARRGWDVERPLDVHHSERGGRIVLRGEEVDRLEIHLGRGGGSTYTGYLRVAGRLSPLPIGSALDPSSGVFTWAPGVGFIGNYDLVFVRWAGARPIERREIRIVLQPKGRGAVGPQVVIDTPRAQQDLPQPFAVAGWSADLGVTADTGIATIHAWAYPLADGAPVFLGPAEYGIRRPDVAAVYGQQFEHTGFRVGVNGLPPGLYDLWLFPWSTVTGKFEPAISLRVTVR